MRKKIDILALRKRTKRDDLLALDQVAAYIIKRTGTLVTRTRIGRWINSGELPTLRRFGRGGYHVTRRCYVDDLIRKYTAS
jgi:hypothetical protein